jgi:hypothetical protein
VWPRKKCAAVLAPFSCHLFNWSLEHGAVPSTFKSSPITPLLKKIDLNPANIRSYMPISDLYVIYKLVEPTLGKQLVKYFRNNNLLPIHQSADRSFHSTDTTVLIVLSDIVLPPDSGDLAILTLLELSTAFDSADHPILLQ